MIRRRSGVPKKAPPSASRSRLMGRRPVRVSADDRAVQHVAERVRGERSLSAMLQHHCSRPFMGCVFGCNRAGDQPKCQHRDRNPEDEARCQPLGRERELSVTAALSRSKAAPTRRGPHVSLPAATTARLRSHAEVASEVADGPAKQLEGQRSRRDGRRGSPRSRSPVQSGKVWDVRFRRSSV